MDQIDEWEIENFSCWNDAIHGDGGHIIYSKLFPYFTLYPRGFDGSGEFITVVMAAGIYFNNVHELFFFGSDGSLICKRRSDVSSTNEYKTFTGPKFEDVVDGIRKNELYDNDRLLIRWKRPKELDNRRLHTVLDASSAFFQVKPEMLNSNDWTQISNITFATMDDSEQCGISVSAHKTSSLIDDTKVKFKLMSHKEGIMFVKASIWIKKQGSVMRIHEHDCVFIKEGDEIIPFEVLLKNVQELKVIMRCKLLTGRSHPDYSRDSSILPLYPHITITNSLSPVVSDTSGDSNSASIHRVPLSENAVTVLAKDFMCLYQDNRLSDLELRCKTISFPTHRAILSARSPVFKAMLSGDMKEAARGLVDIEDLDPHTLGRFLSFLYSGATGEEPLQWEGASKLYYAADKYQVPSLKEVCAAVLRDSVAFENVCDILTLANQHQDEELVSVTHAFILMNYNEVLKSENWEKFMLNDPLLAVKTLTLITKDKHVSINAPK